MNLEDHQILINKCENRENNIFVCPDYGLLNSPQISSKIKIEPSNFVNKYATPIIEEPSFYLPEKNNLQEHYYIGDQFDQSIRTQNIFGSTWNYNATIYKNESVNNLIYSSNLNTQITDYSDSIYPSNYANSKSKLEFIGNNYQKCENNYDLNINSNYVNENLIQNSLVYLDNFKLSKEIELEGYYRFLRKTKGNLQELFGNDIKISEFTESIDHDTFNKLIKDYNFHQLDTIEEIQHNFLLYISISENIEFTSSQINKTLKIIGFLIKLGLKKKLLNKRRIFKRIYSFHFKNLDDYHKDE